MCAQTLSRRRQSSRAPCRTLPTSNAVPRRIRAPACPKPAHLHGDRRGRVAPVPLSVRNDVIALDNQRRGVHMPGERLYGTPEEVRRLLSATGAEQEALMRTLLGGWSVPEAAGRLTHVTAGGLIVSQDAVGAPNPLDHMRVYLTTEDIFGPGQILSVAAIVDAVRQASLETVLAWCANWIAKLHHPNLSQQDVDAEFIATHLDGAYRGRIENLLRPPENVLLATQTFFVIAKIAIEHCERRGEPPEQEDLRPLVTAALALPAHLSAEVEGLAEGDLVVDATAGPMAIYLVANQLFNNATNWQSAWAVYHRCLRELPRELNGHPRVLDFEAAYLDATGVPLDDLVTICAVVWARSLQDGPTLPLSYFDPLGWEPSRLDAVLRLIAATPDILRDLLRQDANSLGLLWSTKTFDQFPIVRWDDHLTVLHPGWLVSRSTGLWPLLDVRRELAVRGDAGRASRIAASVEYTHEHFALEIIQDLVGGKRMYRDDALRSAYGRRGKVADGAIDYGDSWVVVEVTTAGFQLRTAAGASQESLEQDLDDVVRKAGQVEATIDNIRRHEAALTGRPTATSRRKFFPVVVVASRFAGNPLTFAMLRERLRREDVLQGDDCAPLEVLVFDDLLAMEGAIERHGSGFLSLLAEKAAIERPLVSMADFLAHKLGGNAPLPRRVERSWKEWMQTAISRLRESGQVQPEGSTAEVPGEQPG